MPKSLRCRSAPAFRSRPRDRTRALTASAHGVATELTRDSQSEQLSDRGTSRVNSARLVLILRAGHCHARDYATHHHRRPDPARTGTDTPPFSRITGLTSVKTDLRLPSQ